MQAMLAQFTWYYPITLLDKVKDTGERLFYIRQTSENGWSRLVMTLPALKLKKVIDLLPDIESELYSRK